jgi:hypothetical protein
VAAPPEDGLMGLSTFTAQRKPLAARSVVGREDAVLTTEQRKLEVERYLRRRRYLAIRATVRLTLGLLLAFLVWVLWVKP